MFSFLAEPTAEEATYRERLDGPHNCAVLGHPLDAPDRGLELWRIGVIGDRNVDLNIVRSGSALELTLGLK